MVSGSPGPWIRRFTVGDAACVRLVCFPHAGGAANYFHGLSALMPPTVEILAVQYPGRQDRLAERPIEAVPELAARITERLASWADRPLVLFGHSMGAVVAFEVARRLEREPAGLIVSGHRAPSVPMRTSPSHHDDDMLISVLEELDGTDARLLADPEMRKIILSALRADYRAIETYAYVPGPPVSFPLSVMVGDTDPDVTLADARAWGEHSSARCGVRVFRGGHFYLRSWPAEVVESVVADLLSFCGADLLSFCGSDGP
ncbi:thioesterase II family protein [Streptosporangium sp. NPDC000396]|uniref:thioesterase II family protein n=1 Tax=Streptosporangium sp. NPDC000396 TaxID=3366185 RepID=UPI00369D1CAA